MPKSVKVAALRFLKLRPHSIAELKEKLKHKGFSDADIEGAVLDLAAARLLDDRAFTNSWINDRLARPFGFKRIIKELKNKGVDEELIHQMIDPLRGNYPERDIVWELAQRRLSKLTGVDGEKKKKRIAGFLLRRGFSEDAVIDVLKRL